jgi:hypothetical protein
MFPIAGYHISHRRTKPFSFHSCEVVKAGMLSFVTVVMDAVTEKNVSVAWSAGLALVRSWGPGDKVVLLFSFRPS